MTLGIEAYQSEEPTLAFASTTVSVVMSMMQSVVSEGLA